MERTEEQNADYVSYRIERRQQYHDPVIKYTEHTQQPKNCITAEEQSGCQHCAVVCFLYGIGVCCLDKIPFELLLDTTAFNGIREKTECHLDYKDYEQDYYRAASDLL